MLVITDYSQLVIKDAIYIAPSKITQMIFAVLKDWCHHIVLTHSCKLVIRRIKRKKGLTDLSVGEVKYQKSAVNFEQEGCIFYLYGEQKPLGGLSQIFFLR